MRILVLSNFYPPHFIGGYELGCYEAVEALRAAGHHVDVLTSDYCPESGGVRGARAAGDGEHVRRHLQTSADRPTGLRQLRREVQNRRAFREALRRCRPDVLYVWNVSHVSFGLLELVREAGVPSAFYVFDDWMSAWGADDAWIATWERRKSRAWERRLRMLVRAVLDRVGPSTRRPPKHVSSVQFASRYLQERALAAGVRADDMRVIHWGVDLDVYRCLIREGGARPTKLLYVGQLVPHKGVHTAIEALALLVETGRCPEATLTVVGGSTMPSYVKRLEALVEERGLRGRVELAGGLPRESLAAVYARHDVAIVPSIWAEPFGIVQLEAMASGLAVVGTATGGSAEVLRDGVNGLVFGVDDAAACAACIARLIAEPELYDRLRLAGRGIVEKEFTIGRTVGEIESALAEIAGRANAASAPARD